MPAGGLRARLLFPGRQVTRDFKKGVVCRPPAAACSRARDRKPGPAPRFAYCLRMRDIGGPAVTAQDASQRSSCESSGGDSSGFDCPASVCTALPAIFAKFFLRPVSEVTSAAFRLAAQAQVLSSGGEGTPENDARTCLKSPFDRHFCDSEQDPSESMPLSGRRSISSRRESQGIAARTRATALHTRFLNVEDVFFLSAVVIENAVPTIRVGADTTPPLGSD